MEQFYYFAADGRRLGALPLSILKTLAQGEQILPETTLEAEDGRRFRADEKLDAADFGVRTTEDAPQETHGGVRSFSVEKTENLYAPLNIDERVDRLVAFFETIDTEKKKPKKPSARRVAELFHFYDERNRRWGPVSVAELKQFAYEKRIDEKTIIEARDGARKRVVDIPELAAIIQANARADEEKLDCLTILLIVLLSVLGAGAAIAWGIFALTDSAFWGRWAQYGAVAFLALWAGWRGILKTV